MFGLWLSWLPRWTISLAQEADIVRLYSCVIDIEGVIRVRCSVKALSHSNSLSQYVTTSMNDLVGPGRTGRTFVSACAQLWCWSSSLILRDVIISLSFPVTTYQWRWSVFDYLDVYWWTISLILDDRAYVCIRVCSTLVLVFELNLAWRHNLTLIPCHNIPMAMLGDWLSWCVLMNDLVDLGRTDRTFVSTCAWLKRCCLCLS